MDPKFTQDKFIKNLSRLEYLAYTSSAKPSQLCECIQYISEALVWSEQNHQHFFKYPPLSTFKFNNIQGLFTTLLKDHKNSDLIIQLIQSANILIHNLSSSDHKSNRKSGFLLASDFFYTLVSTDFDFSDDEIVENFISFLKGLAANLTPDLLLSYVILTKFQVFCQAFKFFFHPDTMIRNAARTSILTIIKCEVYLVTESSVFSFLCDFEFTSQILKKVVESWQRLYNQVRIGDSVVVNDLLSEISDDLLYINDLMEHIEELSSDISTKFLCMCIPWVVHKISDVLNVGENFAPVGWIIMCILDNIKSNSILDVLTSALFSSKINEKIAGYMREGTVQNNQFEYFEEDEFINNTVKHQIISLLNDPFCATTVLLIINNVISNSQLSKRTLYECRLLPKDELKTQLLIRKVLQDKVEYETDSLVAEFLIQILLAGQSVFNVMLAGRILGLCRLHPEEKYMDGLQEQMNAAILAIIESLLGRIETERFKEHVLEAFEDGAEFVQGLVIEDKVEFPVQFLSNSGSLMPAVYRTPKSSSEIYQCEVRTLFLISFFENAIFSVDRFKGVKNLIEDQREKRAVLNIECEFEEFIQIDNFFLRVVCGDEEKVRNLRSIEVMVDNKMNNVLHLISNDLKAPLNVNRRFADGKECSMGKKIIEEKRKESKIREIELIKRCLVEERVRRTGEVL